MSVFLMHLNSFEPKALKMVICRHYMPNVQPYVCHKLVKPSTGTTYKILIYTVKLLYMQANSLYQLLKNCYLKWIVPLYWFSTLLSLYVLCDVTDYNIN